MSVERDEFEPPWPPAPAPTLPSGLRIRLQALTLDLRSVAAALTRHARQEEARFERRRQRRRAESRARREGRAGR
jgi:hypothetical protein